MANRNTLWAEVFVDELARSGLTAVCAAPGSRHTPLMVAFARHDTIRVYSHLDERSAGFFALGLALASDSPVALVCTSGTAAANFFPAVVEAYQSRVPLIVLTADRPPELRHSGANQTIDQIKLYGDYALWAADAALPEAAPTAVAIRNLRTTAARALATANGLRKGVVHINFPFRKPLEPTPVEGDTIAVPTDAKARLDNAPYTRYSPPQVAADPQDSSWLADQIAAHERGLIVCGPCCPGGDFPQAVSELARLAGYPLLADPLSGVRFGNTIAFGGYDTFLQQPPIDPPDIVFRFGDVPTSKWLNTYLDDSRIQQSIHIRASGIWADDTHRTTAFIQADEARLCRLTQESLAATWGSQFRRESRWYAQVSNVEAATRSALQVGLAEAAYFDGAVVADVIDLIPPESTLFVGNSLPVRHTDQFGLPGSKPLHVYANRGASGIDGNTSTALGAGAARPEKPLVFISGDITFYHDMNGLLAAQRCGVPIKIVLINNDGGGIFYRLPISRFEPEFTDYFVTPHGLDFTHAARLYGLDYVQVNDRDNFRRVFMESVADRASWLIEVRTDARHDLAQRRDIIRGVQEALIAIT